MITYNKKKTFRFSEKQFKTFDILKNYNIDISDFVRNAIKEKLEREKKWIKEKHKEKKEYTPF